MPPAAMGSAQPMGALPAGPAPAGADMAKMAAMKQAAGQMAAMPAAPPGGMSGSASLGPRPGMPAPMGGGMQSMGQAQPMGGGGAGWGGGLQSEGMMGGPMPPGGAQNMQAQQSFDQMMAKGNAMNAANAPVTPATAGMAGKVMPGAPVARGMAMKKGGKVPEKYAKGGSVGGRGDGIAQRGKTRGRMV
jgi:hypothetical protein